MNPKNTPGDRRYNARIGEGERTVPCRRMGLTVWEILVVAIAITVIFLLVVLLLPVNGCGAHVDLECMNNIRGLVGRK